MLQQESGFVSVRMGETYDPRTPLGHMRRPDLYRFCNHHKIPYPKDAPAVELRRLIQERGMTGTEPVPEINKYAGLSMPELRAIAQANGVEVSDDTTYDELMALLDGSGSQQAAELVEDSKPAPDYADMKWSDLCKEVTKRGLKRDRKMKREDVVALLSADDASRFTPGETIIETF